MQNVLEQNTKGAQGKAPTRLQVRRKQQSLPMTVTRPRWGGRRSRPRQRTLWSRARLSAAPLFFSSAERTAPFYKLYIPSLLHLPEAIIAAGHNQRTIAIEVYLQGRRRSRGGPWGPFQGEERGSQWSPFPGTLCQAA